MKKRTNKNNPSLIRRLAGKSVNKTTLKTESTEEDDFFSDRRYRLDRRRDLNPKVIPKSGDRRTGRDRRGKNSTFSTANQWYLSSGIEVEEL